MIVVGLPGALTLAGLITLFQRSSEDAYRGRVFGAVSALEGVTVLAGTLGSGYLSQARRRIIPVLAVQAPATWSPGWSCSSGSRRKAESRRAPAPRARVSQRSPRPTASLATGEAQSRTARGLGDGRRGEGFMPLHTQVDESIQDDELKINPVYVRELGSEIPRYRLGEHGMLPRTALQVVRDELILDGNARLNLATFVTTWMEPEAEQLMAECAAKNMIDKDEYPQTAELERRCVNILGSLWHAPRAARRPAAPPPDRVRPACSAGWRCCGGGVRGRRRPGGTRPGRTWSWARTSRCAGRSSAVTGRSSPVTCRWCRGRLHLRGAEATDRCDENTIGVVAILGSTMDGSYEPVQEIARRWTGCKPTGPRRPIHVDAASGGFVAPFLHPELEWDFRVPRVASINTSGHKYGLVYPGVGWVMWRTPDALPDDLVFRVNYLGGEMPTFALNFSRPGAQVAAQYYNFVRLGPRATGACSRPARMWRCHLSARSPRWARSSC